MTKINNKFCKLPKGAKLSFGSGGSKCIIALTCNRAYKYFPSILSSYSETKENKNKIKNEAKFEIEVNKLLTKKIIKTKLSPHIIIYYGDYICNKKPTFFKNCPTYSKALLSKNKISAKCNLIINRYPKISIAPTYILEMEKADNSLENEIKQISKKPFDKIKIFLDRIFFQIFYTLEQIKLVYPNYQHNDLFIRNILTKNSIYEKGINDARPNRINGVKEARINEVKGACPCSYIRYHYKNMTFDVPANGICIKLNDFGMNQINAKLYTKHKLNEFKVIKNPYRDYFAIIYDLYNGSNLGSNSLIKLIKNKSKIKKIDKYFSKLIDVKNIKKIIKNNKKRHLDWDWDSTYDHKVVKLFGLKKINYYLQKYKKIYPYNKDNYIIAEYGK
jgi:hypothetical protein